MSSDMSLEKHVSVVSAACFSHLRQIRHVQQSLDSESAATLVRVFVTSRVDYCNAVGAAHNGKLHAKSRRRQSSTPAVHQSAEDDCSAVSTGQLWSSVFRCCGPVDLEFAAKQSS